MIDCPGNDPSCPCQDGDICHYRGKNPWKLDLSRLAESHKQALRGEGRTLEEIENEILYGYHPDDDMDMDGNVPKTPPWRKPEGDLR